MLVSELVSLLDDYDPEAVVCFQETHGGSTVELHGVDIVADTDADPFVVIHGFEGEVLVTSSAP